MSAPVSRTGATDREVDDFPVGTIALIHVSDDIGDSWPIVERVPGGWQSGAHHYPDSDEPDDILVLAARAAAAPDSERWFDYSTLAVPVEGHVLACQGCGALVLDNENALNMHNRFHAALLAEQPGGGR